MSEINVLGRKAIFIVSPDSLEIVSIEFLAFV